MDDRLVVDKSRLLTYVIESTFDSAIIINDIKRIYKKHFKSKKPSLGSSSIHKPGPATLTSTSTGTTDLMPSILACESDATASAQVTGAGVSVSVQLRQSHLLSIGLLLLSRALIISESLPRFPLWRLVIFVL
jgi:hypothetical protein